ncbi:hypothetical protein [Halopiger thermotolerans]
MIPVDVGPELVLLVVTVCLSSMNVILAYDTRVFQKRATIREALEQLDPFIEEKPDFKIDHSLIDFRYLSRTQGVTILFRYISLFNATTATGGQPRRFHEILRAGTPFPGPETIIDDVNNIEGVSDSKFTDRGLEVEINSTDPIQIVDIIHQVQRIFRFQLRKSNPIE